jgi:hypothetical protein
MQKQKQCHLTDINVQKIVLISADIGHDFNNFSATKKTAVVGPNHLR